MDAAGTTKYAYAAGGQVFTEDGPFSSDTLTNFYWNRMRTNLSLQQPTGKWTNAFGYDSARRLTSVTSPAGSFDYTLGGASAASPLLKKLALPNTSYITNTYDSVARLLSTKLNNSSDTALDSYAYTYNAANQRSQVTRTDASTYDFTYDPFAQLKIANSSVNSEDRGYKYDAAWNLNYRTNNGALQTFSVDSKNELTAIPGGTPDYDDNGNLTTDGLFASFTYDDENRLERFDWRNAGAGNDPDDGDLRTDFAYDGLGRLRERVEYYYDGGWAEGERVRYVYDGWRVIQERNGANTPTVSYTRGTDLSGSLQGAGGIGGLLARSHGYSSGNWSTHNFYHADGNGNITYLVNSSQTLAASYRYDPFGNTISSSGSLASANVYRFSSKEIHVNGGMYYYGYRFYDPNLQRWLNRDPIHEAGHINLYSFLINNPVTKLDRFGLQPRPTPIEPFTWEVYRDEGDPNWGGRFTVRLSDPNDLRNRLDSDWNHAHPHQDNILEAILHWIEPRPQPTPEQVEYDFHWTIHDPPTDQPRIIPARPPSPPRPQPKPQPNCVYGNPSGNNPPTEIIIPAP